MSSLSAGGKRVLSSQALDPRWYRISVSWFFYRWLCSSSWVTWAFSVSSKRLVLICCFPSARITTRTKWNGRSISLRPTHAVQFHKWRVHPLKHEVVPSRKHAPARRLSDWLLGSVRVYYREVPYLMLDEVAWFANSFLVFSVGQVGKVRQGFPCQCLLP